MTGGLERGKYPPTDDTQIPEERVGSRLGGEYPPAVNLRTRPRKSAGSASGAGKAPAAPVGPGKRRQRQWGRESAGRASGAGKAPAAPSAPAAGADGRGCGPRLGAGGDGGPRRLRIPECERFRFECDCGQRSRSAAAKPRGRRRRGRRGGAPEGGSEAGECRRAAAKPQRRRRAGQRRRRGGGGQGIEGARRKPWANRGPRRRPRGALNRVSQYR